MYGFQPLSIPAVNAFDLRFGARCALSCNFRMYTVLGDNDSAEKEHCADDHGSIHCVDTETYSVCSSCMDGSLTFYRNRHRDGKMALFRRCRYEVIKQLAQHYCPPTYFSTGSSPMCQFTASAGETETKIRSNYYGA